ncbi:extensin family protein [Aureimonas sp. SK2]|uniref:extensin-like domain-containing protein n=1 Tax=Aureimonas sp. SK2 TaxID=3015992 RepID=UPI002444ADD1|nr:extensin family protein [Aureimonas sp. SK2]
MVPSRTGWRIVTLAVAVYAAASADRPLLAMDFKPVPPADIPGEGMVARDARTGARLVWGAPVPPAYIPSPSAVDAAPAYAAPEPVQPMPEPVLAAPAPVPAALPEPGPGDYGRTYPVQEAAPPALQEAALEPLGAPRVIDDGGALPEEELPDSGFDPWEGLTEPEVEPPPEPAPARPAQRRSTVPSWASLGGDRPLSPIARPPRGALERETPDGYRPIAKSEAMCRRELKKLGVRFTDISPLSSGRSCGIDDPVRVTEALKGIAMLPPATLNCQTALNVARWLRDDVKPAARWKLWKQPTALINLSSYRCSRIAGSRTISEHAGGNALDVGGFRFADGSVVKVEPKGPFAWREKPFQNEIRRASCRHFGTVLGPGYNRAHRDHLHLDSKVRLRPVCK